MAFPQDQVSWLTANRDNTARYMFIPQFLVALLFLGFAYYTGHDRLRLLVHGVPAQGRIVSLRAVPMSSHSSVNSRLSDTHYAYLPTVEFTVGDRVVRFEEWMGMRSNSGVGTLMSILYDPVSPAVAMIDRGYLNFLPWGVCFVIGLPVLLSALKGLFSFLVSLSRAPNKVAQT